MSDNQQVAQTTAPSSRTLLIVDDEPSILKALKRLFHGQAYRLVIADDAQKALAYMKKNAVEVLISDMQMPGMSGSEFLSAVAKEFENTYRIVLSGQADSESTMVAINDGKIHRYLQKPWDNQALLDVVNEGFEHASTKTSQSGSSDEWKTKYEALVNANKALEQKVEFRTQQVKSALNKAERHVNALKKSLYHTITVNPYLNSAFSKQVSKLAEKIGHKMGLQAQEVADLRYAALICELGLLGVPANVIAKPYFNLSGKEQEQYLHQCEYARTILAPLPQLEAIVDIVCNQYEYVNGKGYPGKLSDDSLSRGAKIVSVARDFYRYMDGKIDADKHNASVALQLMQKFSGLQYDTIAMKVLNELMQDDKPATNDIGIATADLVEGMVLKEALFNKNDILVLPGEHTFDEASIARLIGLEKRFNMHFSILVADPS